MGQPGLETLIFGIGKVIPLKTYGIHAFIGNDPVQGVQEGIAVLHHLNVRTYLFPGLDGVAEINNEPCSVHAD